MKKSLLAVIALLLVACSGTPTPPTLYLLRSDEASESRAIQRSVHYGLGNLEIASYLDQGGLVMETGEGSIHIARHHRWAEPMADSLRYFLATEISAAAGQDVLFDEERATETRIDIIINKLQGTRNGTAVLVGYWRMTGTENKAFQFAESEPLSTDGYEALFEAEKVLLRRFAHDIAASLKPLAES